MARKYKTSRVIAAVVAFIALFHIGIIALFFFWKYLSGYWHWLDRQI